MSATRSATTTATRTEAPRSAPPVASVPPVGDGRPRVLVVDDDQWIRDCVAQLLTEEGYAVCPVADGAAALEAVERMARSGQGQPDVILLDMRMPVMDGWTFARAYRQRRLPHAPIIVVTAGTDAAECAATIRADGALAKPFDFDELLAIVNAFARRVVA